MVRPPYDPFPVDIWALGILFLEVLCGCDVVTKTALSGSRPANSAEKKLLTSRIGDYFESMMDPGEFAS